MSDAPGHQWLSGLDLSGLLVSEPVLREHFPDGPPPVGERLHRRVATEWERFQLRPDEGRTRWLNLILEDLTGIGRERWRKHPDIPEQATYASEAGQTLRPSRVLVDEDGQALLLVWVAPAGHDLDRRETESGRWHASPATKLEALMRAVEVPLGLATNGRQFRLMYLAEGATPHLTWTADTWVDDPPTLDGFAMLLGADRFFGPEKARLLSMLQDSQKRQLDVTDQLRDQVRQALDQLVRAIGHADRHAEGRILADMSFEQVYEMALVFMMRLVFLLYGEEKGLLPHGEMLYDRSYGITHLASCLAREKREDEAAMLRRFDAFPQLLATFRLIHEGYGGHLFDPARFPALEDRRLRISNAIMGAILHKLTHAEGKVGRARVLQRLSYRELDVEQLGSVYEGLIDGMVRRAEEIMVTIDAGDQPVVALSELESRRGKDLADFLQSVSSMSAQRAQTAAAAAAEPDPQVGAPDGAEALDAETLHRLAPYASFLDLAATVMPGDLYMVHQSGARKAGGQYYTPRWITHFICTRTLEPLCYEGEGDQRRIKPPADILALNVCDPAMGSGAFLVQACRYLAARLVESWSACAKQAGGEPIAIPFGEPLSQANGAMPHALPDDEDEAFTWAMRFVADSCLYGVEVNPLAVELAKMSLWLVTLSEDRPFTFLDHRLKLGNSIIGAWADDIDRYPAAAWDRKAERGSGLSETLKEVRKQVRDQLKQAEKDAKSGTLQLLSAQVPDVREQASEAIRLIERVDIDDPGEKERRYHAALLDNERWQAVRRMYDAWCALWFWPIASPPDPLSVPERGSNDTACEALPPSPERGGAGGGAPSSDLPLVWAWRELMQSIAPGAEAPVLSAATPERIERWQQTIAHLRDEIRFFHWELEFPDVFEQRGGFDAVVMNPPWERIKLQENEFFAARAPEIAAAPNAAARKRLIERLPETDPALFAEFRREKDLAENTSVFLRASGHFPLGAVGDINLYPIFAEHGRRLINPRGGVGAVIPSGIATDYYTQDFFRDLMETRTLSALYDFENREGNFHEVNSRIKFALFFVEGPARGGAAADFAFFLLRPEHLRDEWRHLRLTEEEIALLNPNTRTCPIFRSQRDAELTKAIYRRHPVLVREIYDEQGEKVGEENPWGIRFATMFHMANDSSLFRRREELEADGFTLRQPGNHFVRGEMVFLPLYEGKMFWHFDHRWGTFEGQDDHQLAQIGQTRRTGAAEHENPSFSALPRYWVDEGSLRERWPDTAPAEWVAGFRNITNVTSERTAALGLLPRVALGDSTKLITFSATAEEVAGFLAAACSFVFDYVVRQKLGGITFTFHYWRQLPLPSPSRYGDSFCGERLADVIACRVLELVYTAWDIRGFALDLGDEGPPFVWDDERRAQLRAQLDALYFHLYGIERADVEYIMGTFPIVERKDRERHGSYRTRDLILGYYDAYAAGEMEVWLGEEGKREARRHPSPGPSPFRGGE